MYNNIRHQTSIDDSFDDTLYNEEVMLLSLARVLYDLVLSLSFSIFQLQISLSPPKIIQEFCH